MADDQIEQKYNSKGAQLYKTALAKKVKAAVVHILEPSADAQLDAQDEDADGLDELVKLASLDDTTPSSAHFQRTVAPSPSVAAVVPPAAPTEGLLAVNRPVVLMGKDAAASTSLGSSSLQSRAKVMNNLWPMDIADGH